MGDGTLSYLAFDGMMQRFILRVRLRSLRGDTIWATPSSVAEVSRIETFEDGETRTLGGWDWNPHSGGSRMMPFAKGSSFRLSSFADSEGLGSATGSSWGLRRVGRERVNVKPIRNYS